MFSFFKQPSLNFGVQNEEELRETLQGKSFLIVTGTKGVGGALVDSLSKLGGNVVTTGRSWPKDRQIPENVEFIKADLGTMRSCQDFARNKLEGRTFDTVVFTIGIITRPELTRTSEGLEEDLSVSYLSRFAMIHELIQNSALVGRKRVYIFGFPGQEIEPTSVEDMNFEHTTYKQWPAHMNTVVFNEVLVYELARRHSELHVFGLNPGILPTGIRDNFYGGPTILSKVAETAIRWTMPSAEQFVENTVIQLLAAGEYDDKSGICFSRKGEELPIPKWVSNEKNRAEVWSTSEGLISKALRHTGEAVSS